jgi:phosphatidylglycerol:prolipoprotein diacylglycerol transferase
MMGLAWGLGYIIAHRLAPKSVVNLNLILFGLFISSWAGAKIFFLFTSAYINKTIFLASSNFWLGGGFVFYGGLIFGLLFIILYCGLKKIPLETFSFLIISLGVGHAVGRVGCFFAGCCHGIIFEFESVDLHTPVQLFEAVLVLLITISAYNRLKSNNEVIKFYLVSYSVIRFFLEFLRSDLIRGQYLGLSTSQLISVALIIIVSLPYYRDRFRVNKL